MMSLKGFPGTLHEAGIEASKGVTHKDVHLDYELVNDEYANRFPRRMLFINPVS